jgi:hypothetical protein
MVPPQDLQVVFQALTLISVCSCSANSNFRAFQLYTNTKVEIEFGFGLVFLEKYVSSRGFIIMLSLNLIRQKTQVLKLVLTH